MRFQDHKQVFHQAEPNSVAITAIGVLKGFFASRLSLIPQGDFQVCVNIGFQRF